MPRTVADEHINCLVLSHRAHNVLQRAGVHTVGQLARLTDDELLALRHFGVGSLRVVRAALRAYQPSVGVASVGPNAAAVKRPSDGLLVKTLDLPLSAYAGLQALGVTTVGELRRLNKKQLLDLPYVGSSKLAMIEAALARIDHSRDDELRVQETTPGRLGDGPRAMPSMKELAPAARSIREAYEIAIRSLNSRQLRVVECRSGVGDGTKWTLEEIGTELGVTKQRIRQIEEQAKRKLRNLPREHLTKPLRRAVRAAAECTDVATSEDDLVVNLRALDIECDPLDLRILGLFMDVGWIKPPRGVEMNFGSALPVVRAREGIAEILRLGHQHSRNTGATSARAIATALGFPPDECRELLALNGFRPIDDDWLVPRQIPSPFLAHMMYLHTYCGDVLSLSTLRNALRRGLKRHTANRGIPVPPSVVLGAVLVNTGEFCVASNSSIWKPKHIMANELELSGSGQVMIEVLDRYPVATFFEIRDAVVGAGLTSITASTMLSSNGIFRRVEVGLYARTGREFSLGDLRDAKTRRPPDVPSQADITFLRTGVVRFEINIGGWGEGGVLSNPKVERLAGRWPILVNRERTGVAVVKSTFIYGLSNAFGKLSVERGDRLRLDFDMRARTVELSKVGSKAKVAS